MSAEFPSTTSNADKPSTQTKGGRMRRAVMPGIAVLALIIMSGAALGVAAISKSHSKVNVGRMRAASSDENCIPATSGMSYVDVSIQGKQLPIQPGVTHMTVHNDDTSAAVDVRQCQTTDNNSSSVSVDMHEMMEQRGGDDE